ncbi:tyrosinase family protein [Blastococcus deserti]|uniref:Tyrosinase family protein n=1 Tax=Blastococcus deserti TaxID=2259033 RepID=A0ABW4XFF4_9ACTN
MVLRCRRNVATLTAAERQKFRNAVFRLHEQGRYQRYIAFHAFVSNLGHFGPAFLPWHRVMLKEFEDELISVDPTVTLPYWDFTSSNVDSTGTTLIWNSDLFGGNGTVTLSWTGQDGATKTWTIRRDNFGITSTPVTAQSVTDALDQTTYQSVPGAPGFRRALENAAHGAAHVWLGGDPGNDQADFATAVNDPFFFLLHANVDRIWSQWQQRRKEAWLAANPGLPYPAGQPAADYFYDGLTPATTWPTPPNRHNLDNALWPWDGTQAQPGNPASSFPPWNAGVPETYTPRLTLKSYDFGGYLHDTDKPLVELATPSVTFPGVAEGHTSVAAVVLTARACAGTATVQIPAAGGPGAGFGTPFGTTAVFDPATGPDEGELRLWVSYTGTTAGASASTTVTVQCLETTESWTVPVTALTVDKPKVAAALVLDRSGSMAENAGLGDSQQRMDVLRQSAPIFVDLLDDADGVGVASFSGDATADMAITPAGGAPFGSGRISARGTIGTLSPGGTTSVGDGVTAGQGLLSSSTGFDSTAVVVLTDGYENTPTYIADIASPVNSRVFAIGVGTPEYLNPSALDALTAGTGGYLTMTGTPVVDTLRLSKYFLQILAGVTNADIVVDPEGRLAPGAEHHHTFSLTDHDVDADVVVLLPGPGVVDLSLQAPSGVELTPGTLTSTGASYVMGERVSYWRLRLPVATNGTLDRAGRWTAVLKVDDAALERYLATLRDNPKAVRDVTAHGVPYTLAVHAESDVRLVARLVQKSREPGAKAFLSARLTELGLPMRGPASAEVEIVWPDGQVERARPKQDDAGTFQFVHPLRAPGAYHFRLLVRGLTHRGQPFTREQFFTASVWRGGDEPPPTGDKPLPSPETEMPSPEPRRGQERPQITINVLDQEVMRRLLAEATAADTAGR